MLIRLIAYAMLGTLSIASAIAQDRPEPPPRDRPGQERPRPPQDRPPRERPLREDGV